MLRVMVLSRNNKPQIPNPISRHTATNRKLFNSAPSDLASVPVNQTALNRLQVDSRTSTLKHLASQHMKEKGVIAPSYFQRSKRMDTVPEYIDAKRFCEMLGIGASTLERLRVAGRLPVSIKVGRNRRWSLAAVKTWLAEVEAEGQLELV